MQRELDRWREMSIRTSSPQGLMVLLFDGALKAMGQARAGVALGDIEASHNALMQAQDIVLALTSVLSPDWPPTANCIKLFGFVHSRLVDANWKKALEPLDEAEPVLRELREAFAQLGQGSLSPVGVGAGGSQDRKGGLDFAG